jgi:class 3 adenylate cyclase
LTYDAARGNRRRPILRCKSCDTENQADASSCAACGAELKTTCTRCGSLNGLDARFCSQCAFSLRHSSSGAARGGERRRLTILFCDVVEATALSGRLDPEDLREVLRDYQMVCSGIVRQHDGHVAQLQGDGVVAYFGYPSGHEGMPEAAIRAGLAIVRAFETRSISRLGSERLKVRIGVHTGPVVMGDMGDPTRSEYVATGETPNLAARVLAEAAPNWVVVSEATYSLAKNAFRFHGLGARTLKGFSSPVHLYQVEAAKSPSGEVHRAAGEDASPREAAALVGRERESALLRSLWDDAKAGKGPVVTIRGEPGIGKSRQLRALREELEAEDALAVSCFCSPYLQSTALYPIISMLERRLGFRAESTPADKLRLLEAELARSAIGVEAALPLLKALLSLEGAGAASPPVTSQRQRVATFEVLVSWLLEAAKDRPVLFIVEDVQWADPSTIELLKLMAARVPGHQAMIALTHRPEFRLPWMNDAIHQVAIERLGASEMRAIVERLAPGDALAPEVVDQIMAKADGIPLFVEEITRAVSEAEPDSLTESGAHLRPVTIPATVQDSLTSRLDRLGSSKVVALMAAALGRAFSFELLLAVSGLTEADLRRRLERLIGAELMFRRASAGQETYIFKHALVQEAAYELLLRSTRQQYHLQIARTLVERFPDLAAGQPELLAQHYTAAGHPAEATLQWGLAGQRAIARSAFAEAITAFTHALEVLAGTPESEARDRGEIDLLSGLGLALISTRGFSSKEVEQTYARAGALCDRYGDVPMRVLFGLWAVELVRGNIEGTARLAATFSRFVRTSTDRDSLLISHACLSNRAFSYGDYARAAESGRTGRSFCDLEQPRQQLDRLMRDYGYEGILYPHLLEAWCDASQARPEACEATWAEAAGLAERIDHPYVRAMAAAYGAAFAHDLGRPELAVQRAGTVIAICSEHGFPFWLAIGLCIAGWGNAFGGDRAATATLKQGLDILRAIGASVILPYYLSYLGEIQLAAGELDDGLGTVEEALAITRTNLGRHQVPELLRLKGELLLGKRDAAGAERALRRAVELAGADKATVLERRAAASLERFAAR